ncbi:beta-galactosidase [Paenibacillus sp. V4I7]|uniref:beta-galactosidase n=1 Tax=unclassified Paenibacillus TaxID=185978 RepID=UPI0035931121
MLPSARALRQSSLTTEIRIRFSERNATFKNPSYLLDWKRFETDSVARFQQLQVNLLRKRCPGHFVTHNIWSYPMSLDYYKLCESLDFA